MKTYSRLNHNYNENNNRSKTENLGEDSRSSCWPAIRNQIPRRDSMTISLAKLVVTPSGVSS